jgi:hypothetical protein
MEDWINPFCRQPSLDCDPVQSLVLYPPSSILILYLLNPHLGSAGLLTPTLAAVAWAIFK